MSRKVPVGPFATVTSVRTPRASSSVRIIRPAGSSPTVPSTVVSAPAARAATAALNAEPAGSSRIRASWPDALREHVDEQLADRDESHRR